MKTTWTYPSERIPFLTGEALITAHSAKSAFIASIEDEEDFVLNGIPLEFRIWLKQNEFGQWQATQIFSYRTDNEFPFQPRKPATDSQRQKLYSGAVAAAEALSEEVLLRAEIAKSQHEVEQLDEKVAEVKKELVDALLVFESAKSKLADLLSEIGE